MPISFTSIPVVDFGRLCDLLTKMTKLEVLWAAAFDVGFLYLTNTGLEVSEICRDIVTEIEDVIDKISCRAWWRRCRKRWSGSLHFLQSRKVHPNVEFFAFFEIYKPRNWNHIKDNGYQRGKQQTGLCCIIHHLLSCSNLTSALRVRYRKHVIHFRGD